MDASAIAKLSIVSSSPAGLEIETAQAVHRINLVDEWQIPKGSRVLELGCGQGNTTLVLAEAIGDLPTSHIDAVDPGAPDYGSPYTLSQAQSHISSGPLASRITWHTAVDPESFLLRSSSAPDDTHCWDVAVLAHSIWYFSSPSQLTRLLALLLPRVSTLCVAEYALKASHPGATPHVLAALVRGTVEGMSGERESSENIRCPLGPRGIRERAERVGWRVEREGRVVPGEELADGGWEVGAVLEPGFGEGVEGVVGERMGVVVRSGVEAVAAAVEGLEGGKVRTMDVWVATFGKGG